MADTYINIDPDGDTLIILPFVQATNATEDAADDESSLFSKGNEMSDVSSPSSDDEMEVELSIPSPLPVIPPEDPLFHGMKEANLYKSSLTIILNPIDEEPLEIASGPASVYGDYDNNTNFQDTYYFKVSMKHLSLASPRAKVVLQGPYLESVPKADGLRHWKFEPIFDPEAFKIVIRIIHTQFNNVPDKVSLEMLSNIAVVVDDLNCRDSVAYFAKLWLQELDKGGSILFGDGLAYARKLFTFWVFGLEERFREETKNAVIYSPDISSSFGLPIPPRILGT